MPDFYSQQYENAGPLARPVIQRSQYLADALRSMRESETPINNGGQLAARLLAQAIGQYAQRRQEERLRNTTLKDAANDPLTALFSPQTPMGAGAGVTPTGAGSPAVPALAEAPTPQQPMAQAPVDPLYNYNAKTRDLAARLLIGEAPPGPGQIAVGNVVRNRASTGMDMADVMTQRGQFEPLGNPQTRARLMAIPTTDPRYQDALRAWDESATNQVAPPGADHFYGPESQRQLSLRDGRPVVPDFARGGGGTMVGGNEFFARGFSPPSGYQMTPPVPMDQAQPAPAPTPPATGGGAPPAGPMPSTGQAGGSPPNIPSVRGMDSIPPEQRQYIYQLLTSGNPQQIAQGRQMAQAAISQALTRPGYRQMLSADGTQIINAPEDPRFGSPFVVDIPGARRQLPPEFEYGPDNQPRLRQNMGTTDVTGQPGAPQAPPGARVMRDRNGNFSIVNGFGEGYMPAGGGAPHGAGPPPGSPVWTPGQGQMGKGGALMAPQPVGVAPVPGGPHDITATQNRVPALIAERDRLRPTLEQANTVFQNINAVRRGVEANGSAGGDLAIANGFQQLLNAGMVTGEEIQAQAQQLGLPGEASRIMAYLRGQGTLTPQSRAAFGRLAEQLYVPRLNQLREQVMSRRQLIDEYGSGSFDLVVPPSLRQELGWEPNPNAPRPAPARAQPAPGAGVGSRPAPRPAPNQAPNTGMSVGGSTGPRVTGRPRRVG